MEDNFAVIRPISNYFDNFKDLTFKFSSLKTKKKVIFDLINVEYISSNVIDIIKKLHLELLKDKVRMEILNCDVNVYRMLIRFGLKENEYLKINEKEI